MSLEIKSFNLNVCLLGLILFFNAPHFLWAGPIENAELNLFGVTATLFTPEGKVKDQMASESIEVLGDRLKSKKFNALLGNGAERWFVSANEGLLLEKGQELQLTGNVRIERKAGEPVLFEAPTATITLNDMRLTSPDEVQVTANQIITKAKGIEVDLKNQHINLKGKVRTQHEPHS